MDMGIDFSKILVILVLILVFFGSKELPKFLREGARLLAKVRRYSDKVKQEINSITSAIDGPGFSQSDAETKVKKQELRKRYLAVRRAIDPMERSEKSKIICDYLMSLERFKKARAVMVYVNMGAEVETKPLIKQLLENGIRVIVPYGRSEAGDLGIGQIADLEKDIVIGGQKVPEPRPELHDNFFRSDLQFIVCPGVAFDSMGGRLGRGRANYDKFLREIDSSKVPLVGLAFDAQIVQGQLPFSYSDVAMRQIITESGFKMSSGFGFVPEPQPEAAQATPDLALPVTNGTPSGPVG